MPPIKILLGYKDRHALPSLTFRPLLAVILGFPNIYSVNVKDMYYKPLAGNLCIDELVVGWPTSKIWFHRPDQAIIMNDNKFSLKLQSLRYLLWKRPFRRVDARKGLNSIGGPDQIAREV